MGPHIGIIQRDLLFLREITPGEKIEISEPFTLDNCYGTFKKSIGNNQSYVGSFVQEFFRASHSVYHYTDSRQILSKLKCLIIQINQYLDHIRFNLQEKEGNRNLQDDYGHELTDLYYKIDEAAKGLNNLQMSYKNCLIPQKFKVAKSIEKKIQAINAIANKAKEILEIYEYGHLLDSTKDLFLVCHSKEKFFKDIPPTLRASLPYGIPVDTLERITSLYNNSPKNVTTNKSWNKGFELLPYTLGEGTYNRAILSYLHGTHETAVCLEQNLHESDESIEVHQQLSKYPEFVKLLGVKRIMEKDQQVRLHKIVELCNEGTVKRYLKKTKIGSFQSLDVFKTQETRVKNSLYWKIINALLRSLTLLKKLKIHHNDIKPDNIFLTRTVDGELIVKIGDFGLSRYVENELDHPKIAGSPSYMSPQYMRAFINYQQITLRNQIKEYEYLIEKYQVYLKHDFKINHLKEYCEREDLSQTPQLWLQSQITYYQSLLEETKNQAEQLLKFPSLSTETMVEIVSDINNDIWSAGCVLYEMRMGKLFLEEYPFGEPFSTKLINLTKKEVELELENDLNLDGLKGLLLHMLDPDPDTRWDADQCLAEFENKMHEFQNELKDFVLIS